MTDTGHVKLFKIRCPRCGTLTDWKGNPDRPFCSSRCRLIDLGCWADEAYSIPAESAPLNDDSDTHREIDE